MAGAIKAVSRRNSTVIPPPSCNIELIKHSDDLYKSIRHFLVLGRMLGIVPLDELGQKNLEHIRFRRTSVKSIISLAIILSLMLCLGASVSFIFMGKVGNINGLMDAVNPIFFFLVGVFTYGFMIKKGNEFKTFLKQWHNCSFSYNNKDAKLKRDVTMIFAFVFVSVVLENVLQQSMQLSLLDRLECYMNGTSYQDFNPLRAYYDRADKPLWSCIFPYHPALSIFLFIWNKLALYSWNYADVFIMVIARALYFQFRTLKEHAEKNVIRHRGAIEGMSPDSSSCGSKQLNDYENWQTITSDFETLLSLLDSAKRLLSPLIFVSYSVNLFFVILHLHMNLTTTEDSLAVSIYKTWSFLHILARAFFLTLFAARVNDYAEEFVGLYRQCPLECYSPKIERLERSTQATKLGLTGLNTFVITKSFMLNLANVVLTFEIVCLQIYNIVI